MMNSSMDDDFPPNPFRSGGGNDPFDPASQQQQQQQQQQQPPMQQQQQQPQGQFQQQQQQQPPMQQPQFQQQQQQQQPQFSGQMQQQQQQYQQDPSTPQSTPTSYWGMCMACFRIETYKAYFDVDTEDIKKRMVAAVTHFHQPQYFRDQVVGVELSMNQAPANTELKGPDLYGPFWITMTLIFLVAATANWSASLRYKNRVAEFEYDINHLIHASSFFTSFVFGVPTVFWLCTRCLSMTGLTWAEWICYYGYSMVPFLPASILCIIPFNLISWLILLAATVASGLLVLRNISTPLLASDPGHQKAPLLIMAMLAAHVVFFLATGITFYHHGKLPHQT